MATPQIDPKTGKNLDKRAEERITRSNTEKASENSDSNICLQLASQLVAFLNGSESDIASKQSESVRINSKCSYKNEGKEMQETSFGEELVDENISDPQHTEVISEVDITEGRNLINKEEVGDPCDIKDKISNTTNDCESGTTKSVDLDVKTKDKKQNAFEVPIEFSIPDIEEPVKNEEKIFRFNKTEKINNANSSIDSGCSSSAQESTQPVAEGAKEEFAPPSSKADDCSVRPKKKKDSFQENSDANICLQLTTQLAAFLNDSPCDVTFKQQEPAIAIVASLLLLLREKQRKAPYGYTSPALSSVASNSGHDINKQVATAQQGMYSNAGMPAPAQHHQSMGGPIASPQPIIQQGQQISRNTIAMQHAAYFPRNSVPPPMQTMARNPIGAVVNQPGQQPSSQYAPMPTMVLLQSNFNLFPPTMISPQLQQMYQQRAYNQPQHPIMTNQQYLWNYNIPPPQNSNGYFPPHGMSSYQTMPSQIIIDPKTGKNAVKVDENTEDTSYRPNCEKETENSNSCLPSDTQLSAVLNDSRTDIASKQPEPVKIGTMCAQEHEELKVLETPAGKIKKTKKKKDLSKQSESKKGGKMDAFLDTKEDAALSLVSSPPPITAAAPTSVSIPVSERNPSPELIMGRENLNSIPMSEENPDTKPQTDTSPLESTSEASFVSINTDRPQQNKMVLKYSYKEDQSSPLNPAERDQYDRENLLQLFARKLTKAKLMDPPTVNNRQTIEPRTLECASPDQWSPLSPGSRKQYDREFLLYLQSQPLSLCKPKNLPNLIVIKDKAHIHKLPEVNSTPSPPVVRGSQGKGGKKSKKIKSLSVDQNIELHKSPNPWRPLHKCETPLHEKDRLKRSVLSVLNKLTPQKFETLLAQLKNLLIDTEEKLSLVSDLVFEKAVYEPMFSAVYANLSKHLALIKRPASGVSGTQVNFRKLLLTKCQTEFEQDRSHELEEKMNNLKAADPEQRKKLQLEYDEEKKKIRHRELGNIRFIGELFKLGMLIEPILHEMIEMLLHEGNDESLEDLSRLLKTIGKELDDAKSTKNSHQGPYGYTSTALSSVASNSGHDINKQVATAQQVMYSNAGMPAPAQHHQSMGGSIASPQPIIQQGQQDSRNTIAMQQAAYYPRNSVPPRAMQTMARNPIGAVVNQPGQQPSSQYAPMPTMVPLQPNFTSFPPTMVSPQFQQMYQQRAYNTPHYPIMANQKYLRNYNTPPPQNSNGYFPSHGMSSYQSMPPQMPPQSIPAQPQPQHTRKGADAIPLIDPKTGKNVLTVDKNAEDSSSRPNSKKESENSDSNICVQFAEQVAAVLNDSRTDIVSKQPEPVRIDTLCSHEHEELRVLYTPSGKIKKTKKKKDLNKQSESKEGGKMDAFLDTKEGVALSLVSSPPPIAAAAPTSVSILVSERNPSPELITDSENLNSIPMSEENPDTTPQTDISPWESTSEASSVSINTDRLQQNKIVFKFSYKEDQWSPLNPEGKKHYDREFLLYLQSQPLSLCKPNNLPNLSVIKDKAHIHQLPKLNRTPSPPVVRGSQRKKGKKSKKIKSLSVDQIIELHKSPNPWRPLHKCETPLNEKDRLKRSVLSVLNKLTPQKFETLLSQLKSLLIDTEEKLSLVSDLVFEKAVCEPMFSAVYANLSKRLALIKVPVSGMFGTQVNFRGLLLAKCQTEFEHDRSNELEEKMKNLKAADPDQRKRLQLEYDEEEKKIRHRKLGNIRFFGELFKLKMFIEPILHEFIKKFLHQGNDESLEYLSRLLKTIGKELDDAKSTKKRHQMDKYFDHMKLIVAKRMTSSRVRFLLQDVLDLRKNNWLPRRPEINPKTIEEIHKEAELEAREQELCKDVTNKRKNTSEIDSFDDSRTSSESNKNSNLLVNPSKLKLTKPDEVESIRLGPVGRCLQTFERDISSGILTTDSDKTALTNKFPNLAEKSPSSNFEEKRLTASSSESNEVCNKECLPAIRKTPFSSKERENMLETANLCTRTSEAKASEIKSTVQVIGNAATTKGRKYVVNRFLIYELALNGPQYNKDDMQGKTTTLVEKFLLNNDFEEAIKNVTELASPNTAHMFIDVAVNQVLQKSSQARCSLGQLLSSLLKKKIITFEQYKKGFAGVLEIIDDYALDIPLIWDYMGEILEPMIEDIATPFKLLKEVLQPCIPSEKAGMLVSSILHCAAKRKGTIKLGEVWRESGVQWTDIIGTDRNVAEFIEKHKLEFTTSPTKVNLQTQMSMEEMKNHLLSLLEKNAELEEVFDWVDANVPDTSGPTFVRALVAAVHESCLSGSGTTWELNTSKLKSRIPLISRYVSTNEKLQLQALYAVQALMNQLGQPSGLLHQFFDVLYDDDVISDESFKEWEQSDDPNEAEGKGVAVHSVKSFFAWLREPAEETEEMNSV